VQSVSWVNNRPKATKDEKKELTRVGGQSKSDGCPTAMEGRE
jgi:hypothetical protein